MARFLRSKRTHSIGVMFFDITDPFCTLVMRGIENTLYQASYVPIFADAHNQRARFERYLEMLMERHVEALIVVANWLFVDIQLLGDLSKRNIPAATIGWELPGDTISSVMVDNETGARLALEHLHQLGHRKIAYIRGPKNADRQRTSMARHSEIRPGRRLGDRSAAGAAAPRVPGSKFEFR